MTDLRAAAERLLHRPAVDGSTFEELMRNCQQHNTDCRDVATAYLADLVEYHVDDGKHLDWSWWEDLPGKPKGSSYTIDLDGVFALYWNGSTVELIAESSERNAPTYTLKREYKTRGDVRRLLAALGVQ